jgi:hypothetical protein
MPHFVLQALGALGLLVVLGGLVFLKKWKHKLVACAAGVVLLGVAFYLAHESFHRMADETRVRHVDEIFAMIVRYRDQVGICPLADRPGPVGVNISHRPLHPRFSKPPPGFTGTIVPFAELEAEVRAALGPDIVFPQDPQKASSGPPNFYQYHVADDDFFVAASLYHPHPKAKPVLDWYYKYELRGECMWLGPWLERNEPIVREYLLGLGLEDIGQPSQGAKLTDGTRLFAGNVFLGMIGVLPEGVHGFLFQRDDAKFACVWTDSGGSTLRLPTCADPAALEHEMISHDVYTFGDIQPGGSIVIVWCPPDDWLASRGNARPSPQR